MFGGSSEAPAKDLAEGLDAAKQAIALDDKDFAAWAALGPLYLLDRKYDLAVEALESSIDINPSSSDAHRWLGMVHAYTGLTDRALTEIDLAARLSPTDPMQWSCMHVRSCAYLHAREYEQAADWAYRALRQPHVSQNPFVVHLIALVHLGREEEARASLERLVQRYPNASIENVLHRTPLKRPEDVQIWAEGLRKAGLPENLSQDG